MTICKYPLKLTSRQRIYVTGLEKVLSVIIQRNPMNQDGLVLYALVNTQNESPANIEIALISTGQNIHGLECYVWNFLGSYNMSDTHLIYHLWYRIHKNVRRRRV